MWVHNGVLDIEWSHWITTYEMSVVYKQAHLQKVNNACICMYLFSDIMKDGSSNGNNCERAVVRMPQNVQSCEEEINSTCTKVFADIWEYTYCSKRIIKQRQWNFGHQRTIKSHISNQDYLYNRNIVACGIGYYKNKTLFHQDCFLSP